MTPPGRRHAAVGVATAGRRRWVRGLVVAAAACAVAVALAVAAGGAPRPAPVTRTSAATPAAPAAAAPVTAAAGVRAGAVAPEEPAAVLLPSGRSVPVRPVGTTPDGTLDVPGDIDVAGWWRDGSRVGDPFGSVLVAAHVDSTTQGLGPFAELLSVRAGQLVVLTSAHLTQEYVITELRLLDRGSLSEHPWVHAPSGPHRLTLVTCAGPFAASEGGYQRLAVVTATPVGRPTPRDA